MAQTDTDTATITVNAVNDAPTRTTASLAAGTEDTAYTVLATALLQGFSDVDFDTLSVANLAANHGTVVDNGNGSYVDHPGRQLQRRRCAHLRRGRRQGRAPAAATQSFSLAAVNDAPSSPARP
ncbi:MAG: cadherin-like domain-containing protein [Alsobacter sp.]